MPASVHLALTHLTKRYGRATVVDDLSLDVPQGELVALLGPSGCGKTTTLRMVVGLVPPTAGEIHLQGRPITHVPPFQRNMGVVYQNYALFPHLNVAQNVAFGLEMRRLPAREIRERVGQALSLVRLEQFGHRRIRELSGGQQQRVALARALVIRPAVLLLDEPLSNLDAKLREEMRTEIREIQRELGITTLFVTHDQAEALTMADRVAVMHQGRIEQIGTPEEIYERPRSRFVATFIGRANLIPGTVVESHAHAARVRIDGGPVVDVPRPPDGARSVVLMVRPHRLRLAPAASSPGWRGRVRRMVFLGDVIQYELDAGQVTLTAETPNDAGQAGLPKIGEDVSIHWRTQDVLVFDAQ